MFWRMVYEGALQALIQLRSNKLRTFLSLLGITIGIFCIIAVRSAVSSLETNIRGSLEKLGDDVLYISKMPWAENPHENFWKYFQRPNPDHEDLENIVDKCESAESAALSVFIGSRTIKHESSFVEGVFLAGVTYDYASILKVEMAEGRWFHDMEYNTGRNVVVLGHTIADQLFPRGNAISKKVRLSGHVFTIIGVIEKAGEDLINPVDFDGVAFIGYNTAKKVANVKAENMFGTSLMVKAKPGVDIEDLKGEITGVLRSIHRLKPKEGNDFAINELSILSALLDDFFSVINLAGFAIGIFAILVGIFSVANIMFVSVKERTSLIGTKMALGANRRTILWEFLVEATCICLVGGGLGLLLVLITVNILGHVIDFNMFMSYENALFGVALSVVIGIVSGILPALRASRLDPVEAMRS